jgi:hypothetical protein
LDQGYPDADFAAFAKAFFEHRSTAPNDTPLTPLQQRMQSGGPGIRLDPPEAPPRGVKPTGG